MPAHETGKQKAARVPLHYHRSRDGRKWRIAAVCAALTAVAAAVCWAGGWWRTVSSPGPLNAAHAAWEADCRRCHETFKPTTGASGLSAPSDSLCQKCHEGPPHHASQKPGEVAGCSSCHRDHRGREASLVRLDDSFCTGCHAKLPDHVTGGQTPYHSTITRFDRDHPDFLVKDATGGRVALASAKDPGKLRFNHKVHMTPGLKYEPEDARPWTLGDINDKDMQERYKRQQPEDERESTSPVRLQCSSCHRLDGGDLAGPAGTAQAPGDGATMLPIRYENDCRACHPLTFLPAGPAVAIPHGLQAPDVHRFLWGAYAGQHVPPPKPADKGLPSRLLPGESPDDEGLRRQIDQEVTAAQRFLSLDSVRKGERLVFQGKTACALCHEHERPAGDGIPTRVIPPAVPRVWLPHAVFNHAAHHAVSCRSCHANADAFMNDKMTPNADASTTSADVLLPTKAVCAECHAPRREEGGQVLGGVRYSCTTCHRYHHGDGGPHGRGDSARGVKEKERLTPREFLSGKKQ